MQKQAFFEIKEVKGKGYNVKSIVPIPYVEWNSYNDMVTLQFQPQIMPYLIDLKKNFTGSFKTRLLKSVKFLYSFIVSVSIRNSLTLIDGLR